MQTTYLYINIFRHLSLFHDNPLRRVKTQGMDDHIVRFRS